MFVALYTAASQHYINTTCSSKPRAINTDL